MARRLPYTLVYAPAFAKHLRAIDVKHHSLIKERIEDQLSFDAEVETKNCKPMRQPAPFDAEWEIRFGPGNRFRVLYEIKEDIHEVHIIAIGEKMLDRLIIGGEEVDL